MPRGQPLSPGFQIFLQNFLSILICIKKKSDQSLQWLRQILAVLDTPVGQPWESNILNFETMVHNFTSISTISPILEQSAQWLLRAHPNLIGRKEEEETEQKQKVSPLCLGYLIMPSIKIEHMVPLC